MNLTDFLYYLARKEAIELQDNAANMTADEVVDASVVVPDFDQERQYLDYPIGYVCKTSSNNVVKLLQPYDSTIYPQQPEELEAQWGFYWSTDPYKAKPFLKSATSPYYKDSCCIENDHVWQSTIDNNTWSPSEYPRGWKDLGPVSDYSE